MTRARRKLTPMEVAAIAVESGGVCRYCQRPMFLLGWPDPQVTIEHLIPVARGGSCYPGNLGISCRSCNSKKGIKTDFEFICWQMQIEVDWYAKLNHEWDWPLDESDPNAWRASCGEDDSSDFFYDDPDTTYDEYLGLSEELDHAQ